jgi:hypothetical protein
MEKIRAAIVQRMSLILEAQLQQADVIHGKEATVSKKKGDGSTIVHARPLIQKDVCIRSLLFMKKPNSMVWDQTWDPHITRPQPRISLVTTSHQLTTQLVPKPLKGRAFKT